jgi:O-antigen/teichoic acid export membrane protein
MDFKHLWLRLRGSALVWSSATTALRFGGVFLVLPVVLRTVPRDQLGLYYVFQTLGIFGVLLDIGIAPTISRSVSFLWAGAPTLEVSGHAEGVSSGGPNWPLMSSVYETFRRFYWIAAFVLLFILSVGCLPYIWHITAELGKPQQGRAIWVFLSIGTAWNFSGTIWPAMLGGINRVREQQMTLLLSISVGYVVTIAGLLLGFELWALAASIIVQATVQRQFARRLFHRAVAAHLSAMAATFDWKLFRTLWPSAWKTGLIGAAVSLYLSAPVFLTSTFLGLDIAGQVGLSIQLAMTVCQVAAVAMIVKTPLLSILRVNKRIEELRRIFCTRLLAYILLYSAGSLAVFVFGDWLLHAIIHSRTQLPSPVILGLIFLLIGIEGLQALFRGLALSANATAFWPWLLIGGLSAVGSGAMEISQGLVSFFVTLILVKFVLLDVPVIRAGLLCLYQETAQPNR